MAGREEGGRWLVAAGYFICREVTRLSDCHQRGKGISMGVFGWVGGGGGSGGVIG